jgi:hypothetical protein
VSCSSLIGDVDHQRSEQIMETILNRVVHAHEDTTDRMSVARQSRRLGLKVWDLDEGTHCPARLFKKLTTEPTFCVGVVRSDEQSRDRRGSN